MNLPGSIASIKAQGPTYFSVRDGFNFKNLVS